MTYQLASLTKEAITHNTGMLARVCIKNGEFEAAPVLPAAANQLSTIQKTALYVVYAKANGNDNAVAIGTALHSGVFDSRVQCIAVYETLKAFGWLTEYEGRYALSAKGQEYVQSYLSSKGAYSKPAIADNSVIDLRKCGEIYQ